MESLRQRRRMPTTVPRPGVTEENFGRTSKTPSSRLLCALPSISQLGPCPPRRECTQDDSETSDEHKAERIQGWQDKQKQNRITRERGSASSGSSHPHMSAIQYASRVRFLVPDGDSPPRTVDNHPPLQETDGGAVHPSPEMAELGNESDASNLGLRGIIYNTKQDDALSEISSEESEAEEAEEESEVEPPKAVGKLLKQISRLTSRSKTAEEKVEAMQAEISALKSQPQEQASPQGSPALEEIADLASLEKVRQEAIAAKKWAVQHLGKEFVEDGDKEYSGDEIREIFGAADEYLTEKIPQRAQFLQAKEQWASDASSTFTFLAEQEGENYELFKQVRNGPQYKQVLDGLPNGDFVAATLVKGIQALKAESKGKTPAKKRTAKTPPATLEESVAPPPQNKDDRQKKRVKDAIGAGNISASQFAELLT